MNYFRKTLGVLLLSILVTGSMFCEELRILTQAGPRHPIIVEINPGSSVLDLKRAIEAQERIPVRDQEIFLLTDVNELSDNSSIDPILVYGRDHDHGFGAVLLMR